MTRSIFLFILSGILSIVTFYFKSEHSIDYHFVIPVGLYFIAATLLAFRPRVEMKEKLLFVGLALLVWLVLFSVSFNLLFPIIAPISGALGAWVVCILCGKYLEIEIPKKWPVILSGFIATLLGLLFMVAVKKLQEETFPIVLNAGVITGLWQVGVGWQLLKSQKD